MGGAAEGGPTADWSCEGRTEEVPVLAIYHPGLGSNGEFNYYRIALGTVCYSSEEISRQLGGTMGAVYKCNL